LASPLVVVVDNSATNLKILARLAESLGEPVDVQAFADPATALLVCAEQRPDLVVAAAEMAPLDGAAFIIRLREESGDAPMPVVVVAAQDDRACVERALAAGAADHIPTPIDHREFRTRLRSLLALRRLEQAARDQGEPTGSGLSRAHERLLRVIDAVPALVCATDGDGRYIFCNQRFDWPAPARSA
jgi:CheY-like chemotaxis protein